MLLYLDSTNSSIITADDDVMITSADQQAAIYQADADEGE